MTRAPIKIDILLGRSKKGSFDARKNAVSDDVRKRLQALLEKRAFTIGADVAASRVQAMEEAIVANIERDLTQFARTATAFFFSRAANERDQLIVPPLSFAPKISVPAVGMKRAVTWQRDSIIKDDDERYSIGYDQPLEWPGLAKSTMRRKARRGGPGATTYFIYNDNLRREMGAAFGSIIAQLFEPSVTFTRSADRDLKTGRFVKGTSVGRITIRVFRSQSDSGTFRGALLGGDWRAAANDTTLLTRYLSALTAAKLNNYAKTGGRGRASIKRPWVGPSIAYWLIHRMPTVISQSVESTVKAQQHG